MSEAQKTRVAISQSQVFVYCSSEEEAGKLAEVLKNYDVDSVDDALRAYPVVVAENKALLLTLDEKVKELNKKAKSLGPKKEEALGSNLKGKKSKK